MWLQSRPPRVDRGGRILQCRLQGGTRSTRRMDLRRLPDTDRPRARSTSVPGAGRKDDPLSIVVATTLVRQYAHPGHGRADAAGKSTTRSSSRVRAGWPPRKYWSIGPTAGHRGPKWAMNSNVRAPAWGKSACDVWAVAIRNPQGASSQLRSRLQSVSESLPAEAGTIALAAAYLGDTSLALDALGVFHIKGRLPDIPGHVVIHCSALCARIRASGT